MATATRQRLRLQRRGRATLWSFGQATMYLMPDVPAVIIGRQFVYDLVLGRSVALNDQSAAYKVTPPHRARFFPPQLLTARWRISATL